MNNNNKKYAFKKSLKVNVTALILTAIAAPSASVVPLPSQVRADIQGQSESTKNETAYVSVLTRNHSRIIRQFDTDNFFSAINLTGSFPTTLVGSGVTTPEYGTKTRTHKLASFTGRSETIKVNSTAPMFTFHHVGFPNIETSRKVKHEQYKPYISIMTLKTNDDGSVKAVPNVACHGYSAERTEARARRYAAKINQYAERYKVDSKLVKAVIAQESCFRMHAVSPVGAVGLMQLMPETAEWLGVKQITDASQNLRAGIRYLSQLKRRFKTDELMLAAYNAGPGNVKRYNGIPPFSETQHYVKKVMQNYQSYIMSDRYNAGLI